LGDSWRAFRCIQPTRFETNFPARFKQNIMAAVGPESPLELRLFTAPVKTDSRGRIITGPNNDPVKTFVGAEPAGIRAGLERFTRITFPVSYDSGSPDPGQRRIGLCSVIWTKAGICRWSRCPG
jgi:hypothetical protein